MESNLQLICWFTYIVYSVSVKVKVLISFIGMWVQNKKQATVVQFYLVFCLCVVQNYVCFLLWYNK